MTNNINEVYKDDSFENFDGFQKTQINYINIYHYFYRNV